MAGAVELSRSRALTVVPARAESTPSGWLLLRPTRLALGLSIIALALHALVLRDALAWAQSISGGVLLMAAGFAWMAWAWVTFRRAHTPIRPTDQPTLLVDHGPFRVSRNPMYLGMVAMMLGLGLASGVPLMLIAVINFVAIIGSVHIPHEEANMKRAFGGWYSDYAASVRRWI
jgi:protein-S-isoprenylcysteine O-methyltransferase Ste14